MLRPGTPADVFEEPNRRPPSAASLILDKLVPELNKRSYELLEIERQLVQWQLLTKDKDRLGLLYGRSCLLVTGTAGHVAVLTSDPASYTQP